MSNRATTSRWLGLLFAVGIAAHAVAGETPPATTTDAVDPFAKTTPTAAPPPSAKLIRYAQRVIGRHDADGDGRLQIDEWKTMAGKPETIDTDQDGVITIEEFAAHVAAYGRYRRMLLLSPDLPNNPVEGDGRGDEYESETKADDLEALRRSKKFYVPNSRLPKGLSQEFFRHDLDGDGQLTLAEFAPKSTAAELERFKNLDTNLDGVVTAREYARGPHAQTPRPEEPALPPAAQP